MIVNTSTVSSLTKPDVIHALQEIESKFKAYVENSPVAIFVANAEAKYEYVNNAASKLLGYSKDELLKMSIHQIVYQLEPNSRLVSFEKTKETGHANVEVALKSKDGNPVYVKINSIKLPDGKLLAYCQNVTDQKKAEEDLRQKYEVLERVGESVGAGLAIIGKDFDVLWANKTLKALGVASDKKCFQTFNNLESVCPDCGVKRVFEENKPIDIHEFKTVNPNGDVMWIELRVTPLKNENGEVTACLELAVPITERKKIEDQLKKNEKHLREIISNAPIGIATSDSDMYFLTANMKFCNILGYSEDELRKLTFKDITVSDDVQESILNMEKLCSGEIDFFSQEKQYIRKDNVTIDGRVTVSAIRDKSGKPTLFIAQMEDITERKKTQQMLVRSERKLREYSMHLKDMVDLRTIQLKDANERLVKSERFAAIGELAGMVGHDLRNPLAGIKNATYFLKKKGSMLSEEQTRVMLENIEKGIDHSDKIINDLLEYAGEIHLKPYPVSAISVLENVLGFIKVPTTVKIINEISSDLIIKVDQNKIERVFINLIKNAIDAMPNGGSVTLRCKHIKDKTEISFADTGTGIPDEVLPKLFNPLFTTKAQGMGFGLAICKRVVEAHGGTITVETARGKGTTFVVTLPTEKKTSSDAENVKIDLFGCQTRERVSQ
ncbi:MAG: PAS domain S-box protein [Betaproteobacteria bacterium]